MSNRSDPSKQHEEHAVQAAAHSVLRIVQKCARALLVVSAIVTGVFLVFLGPLVVAPAIVMALSYLAVLIVNMFERKARPDVEEAQSEPVFDQLHYERKSDGASSTANPDARAGDMHATNQPQISDSSQASKGAGRASARPAEHSNQASGMRLVFLIVMTLNVLAAFLAAVLLDWVVASFAAFVVFIWCLLVGVPVWSAGIREDEGQSEKTLATGRSSAPTSKTTGT